MGPDDPRLIVPLANLGYLLRSVGETSQALGVLERAVGIGERAYGPTHPAIMAALLNLALAHQDLREYDTAIRYAERAFAAHESEVGEDNPLLVTNAVTLGLLTVLAGRPAEALDPLQRAVELASDTATSRIAFAEAHWGLGFAHHRLGNLAMADSLFEVARVSGEASGDFSIHAHFQLRAAAARGDLDAARVWLGAIDDAGDRALYLHRDPVLDPIRHLPDFGSLSDRIRDSVELPPPLP